MLIKNNNLQRIKLIWHFGKKYLFIFIIAEICILVSYSVSILLPLNLSFLTDKVLINGKYELLKNVIVNYVVLFFSSTIFNFIYAFTWQKLNNLYIVDIKKEIFKKVIYAKANYLLNINSGDIMSRIDTDSEQFIHAVQKNLFHFLNSFILCFGIIIIIAKINIIIAIMLIIAALLPIIFTRYCGKFTEKFSKNARECSGVFTGRLFEILKGMREIRLLCAQWWAENNFITPIKKLIKLGNQVKRVDFFVNKGIYFINLSISLVIYIFSAFLIINDKLTIGVFLACIEYIALLHKKINWMLRIYLDWFSRKVSIDRVNEIFLYESEESNNIEITDINSIEFINISFKYNKNYVLKNISFKVEKGEKVAIIGASGVGKTTVIGLLMKLYTPSEGRILINDIPIEKINCFKLRDLISIVSQDVFLFDETIRFNLDFSKHYSDDEISEVLQKVDLKDVIEELPNGIDSKISSLESNLSGGQKQRIMIARMLLKKANTIILDEATSALDIVTENNVVSNILKKNQSTIIIISHRLTSIKKCNKIIVLNENGIEGIGTHEDLIKNSKVYKELFGGEFYAS